MKGGGPRVGPEERKGIKNKEATTTLGLERHHRSSLSVGGRSGLLGLIGPWRSGGATAAGWGAVGWGGGQWGEIGADQRH